MKKQLVLNRNLISRVDTNTMVYIGRPSGSIMLHFGNPFSYLKSSRASVIVGSREESIECFEKWIREEDYKDVEPVRRKWILRNLHLLLGKDLVCWCSPRDCHGRIYLELLKEHKHELHTSSRSF